MDIRHSQNLKESLEQYVIGELLDGPNAYFCEKCNKKVSTARPRPRANVHEPSAGRHGQANVFQETPAGLGHSAETLRLRLGTRDADQVQRLLRISPRIRHGTLHGPRLGQSRRDTGDRRRSLTDPVLHGEHTLQARGDHCTYGTSERGTLLFLRSTQVRLSSFDPSPPETRGGFQ